MRWFGRHGVSILIPTKTDSLNSTKTYHPWAVEPKERGPRSFFQLLYIFCSLKEIGSNFSVSGNLASFGNIHKPQAAWVHAVAQLGDLVFAI
jgi:hypothetical protein